MPETIDLLDSDWVVSSGDTKVKGALPASALQLLQKAQLVPDVLFRYGERDLHWVSDKTWSFWHQFHVPEAFLKQSHIDLLLNGIDTIADISINGKKVLSTDSAFRSYNISAKPHLQAGHNVLEIIIQPASDVGRARHASYPYDVPAVQQVPKGILGSDLDENYNFLRKPACDSGWDWGPKVSQAGIYGPVQLSAYDQSHLTGANVRQTRQKDGSTRLDIQCQIQSAAAAAGGTLSAALPAFDATASCAVVLPAAGVQTVVIQVTVPADAPLWWPRGYGDPVLHDLHVSFTASQYGRIAESVTAAASVPPGSGRDGAHTSEVNKRIGLKWVELERVPLGEGRPGETFSFMVNGMPIFVKGSNMIPSSVFAADETPSRQRALVAAAAAAHQNTLRVWGGGRYPSDAFMDACDEEGMLVWLELMFACALYPVDKPFLQNVAVEARQQMFRLQGHACVLVLGGNNEVENSFPWFPTTSVANPSLYAVDFARLFLDTIRPIVEETGPSIYVDTSPSNGLYSTDPYVKRWNVEDGTSAGGSATNDPRFGDVHFYDYSANGLDALSYPRAKFVSEFGWQSFPSWPGLSKCIDPGMDLGCDSDMSRYRQRHPDGQPELRQQISDHFPLGNALGATESGFRRYIYLTQLHQAMAYDTAIRYWRRIKHEADAQTRGILYWQLNDIWEGASWSGINRDGSWRLMHHAVARAYAPLLASAHLGKDGILRVWIVSDSPHPLEGSLQVDVVPWAAAQAPLSRRQEVPFKVAPLAVESVFQQDLAETLAPLQMVPAEAFILVSATAHGSTEGAVPQQRGRSYTSQAEVHLTELRHAALKEPHLTAEDFQQLSPEQVSFKLSAKAVAAGVALETALPGHFSDNGVHVLPWAPRTLTFTAATTAATAAVTPRRLQESLTMQSVHAPDLQSRRPPS